MKNKKYGLLLKTGDAEMRALGQLKENFHKDFLPIIEITRGRKLKGVNQWPIQGRLKKLYEIFGGGEGICIDLTSSEQLSCDEIKELYDPNKGYEKWRKFTEKVEQEGAFFNIIPCILANFNDVNFVENYSLQVKELLKKYPKVAYRSSLKDDGCYDDFSIIKPFLVEKEQLICIIDCEYITSGGWRSFSEKVIARINNTVNLLGDKVIFVICSTSFPNNVSEIGNDISDSFHLNEIDLFESVKANIDKEIPIIYGDYGSINPIRNDDITMARGWVPRIDVPLSNLIFYYRERRGNKDEYASRFTLSGKSNGKTPKEDYSVVYTRVAKTVIKDKRFPNSLITNWGVNQILACASGASPGSNPSFWISVRMNIHIQQQINRLRNIK